MHTVVPKFIQAHVGSAKGAQTEFKHETNVMTTSCYMPEWIKVVAFEVMMLGDQEVGGSNLARSLQVCI